MSGTVNEYGFTWGPLEVVRAAQMPDGSVALLIKTATQEIEVYASPTGRSLRVFKHRNGAGEMKVVSDE